jgi:hypothetical protein
METSIQATKRGTAFELAEAMDRRYTSDLELRTMFVRAERYRALDAAERMIRFFELKRRLFGAKLMTRDILLSHLDEDDMDALESGGLQVSPLRDTAGRPIVMNMLGVRKYKKPEDMVRAGNGVLVRYV